VTARTAPIVATHRTALGRRLLIRFCIVSMLISLRGGSVTGYFGRAVEGPVRPCDLLRTGLDADPDGLALISADTRWAWRTLDDLSDRLAVSPQEVENALLEHPSVASAGVIGIHDLVHGENVRAYLTLTDGTERPTSQELIQFARARVGYKAPEEIVVLDEMPLTATGKLDRTYLKRMAEANLARGANR
jgi:acyl-CoA synthetase (AMP-forming)/AMP-acid ligase II